MKLKGLGLGLGLDNRVRFSGQLVHVLGFMHRVTIRVRVRVGVRVSKESVVE
jgi:hypothetical protein